MNWGSWLLNNEVQVRLAFFFAILAVMAIWEMLAPRREVTVPKAVSWINNLGLVFLNSLALRLIFPAAAVGVAAVAQQRGWGVMNIYDIPFVFGFSLPWWDRLFGTYRDQPRAGHEGMTIGIHKFRDVRQVQWLPGMLMLPFVGKISGYVINRRSWNKEGDG